MLTVRITKNLYGQNDAKSLELTACLHNEKYAKFQKEAIEFQVSMIEGSETCC